MKGFNPACRDITIHAAASVFTCIYIQQHFNGKGGAVARLGAHQNWAHYMVTMHDEHLEHCRVSVVNCEHAGFTNNFFRNTDLMQSAITWQRPDNRPCLMTLRMLWKAFFFNSHMSICDVCLRPFPWIFRYAIHTSANKHWLRPDICCFDTRILLAHKWEKPWNVRFFLPVTECQLCMHLREGLIDLIQSEANGLQPSHNLSCVAACILHVYLQVL